MTHPASLDAARQLGRRLDDLHQIIQSLKAAEERAIQARQDADIEESKAFLRGEGSIEARKHAAKVATEGFEFEALTAEADVRHKLRLMREAQMRVDVGRTYSADLRAEAAVAGRDGTP